MKTGIFWDERCTKHEVSRGHPESPHRLWAINETIKKHPSLINSKPRMATTEEILSIHTQAMIEKAEQSRGQPLSYLGHEMAANEFTAEAAFLSAGSTIDLVDAIEAGELDNGFSFPRPPGHHAEHDRPMGFCLFNNIAIAAQHLITKRGLSRIAIVDYDVHHGNGTQGSFYDRKDVLFASIHRYPFYPGTGAKQEIGAGQGKGYTVNAPLPGYSDDHVYQKTFDDIIVKAVDDYKPEFILVSAGYDAHERDYMGGMSLTKAGFQHMNEQLLALANKHCSGKIVFVLEGGYDMKGLQEGVESVFETLV
jgi:acetoin utilization deacetylase AcuC-like enzyme